MKDLIILLFPHKGRITCEVAESLEGHIKDFCTLHNYIPAFDEPILRPHTEELVGVTLISKRIVPLAMNFKEWMKMLNSAEEVVWSQEL